MSETTQVIIPGGCLQNTKISLKCKAPDEKIVYTFSLANQLSSDEQIVSVQAQPPYGGGLTVDNYTYNVNIFSCRISGGKMLFDEPIRFVISTQKNTIYSFVCVLPIRQQGTLIENNCGMNGVLDRATPMGTLAVGTTTTLEPGSKATVENIGNDSAAVFNFGIPKGDDGESPTIQIGKTTTLPAGHDATVEATTADNVVTLDFGIPSGTTGEAGQYILNIGTVTTLSPGQDATAEIVSDDKGNHSLNLGIPQGADGNDGISPTLSIGTVTTLDPNEKATAEIVHGADGNDTLNLGLVKGDKGDPGESFPNDGTAALDVESLQLADIQSVNIADIPDGKIMLDSANNQLVRKQNNQWVALNMSNFEIETTYKNNTGVFPINFAPSAYIKSTDAVSDATGLVAGHIYPDTSKKLPTPTTMLIRVDFKISSTDTTDADYYIVGYENKLNIRINPNKKTVSVYSAQNKQYEMDYTALGINLHDDKFHTAYFILNNGYQGYTCYAIDGIYFNKSLTAIDSIYLTKLCFRGDANNSVAANALTIKNIGISSSLPTLLNKQTVPTDFTEFEGYYTLLNNSLENQQLTNGILLKPNSFLDDLNTVIPFSLNNDIAQNQALFNENGLYAGVAAIKNLTDLDTFTFECYFKYNSAYDTETTIRRSIIGNITYGIFSIGIAANSISKFTFKNYQNNTEVTLVDDITKDEWHTLSISCKNNIANIFVDGVKKATVPFNFSSNWNYIYLRALDSNLYIVEENALTIKNISILVGYAKYYKDYDSSLTPSYPNSDGVFYPLIDGVISNQNIKDPVVKIKMNEGDIFSLWTIPNNGTPSSYTSLTPIKYDYDHQPDPQNTKFSLIFLKDISGNPVKESV